jgi:hypothetical protein
MEAIRCRDRKNLNLTIMAAVLTDALRKKIREKEGNGGLNQNLPGINAKRGHKNVE